MQASNVFTTRCKEPIQARNTRSVNVEPTSPEKRERKKENPSRCILDRFEQRSNSLIL